MSIASNEFAFRAVAGNTDIEHKVSLTTIYRTVMKFGGSVLFPHHSIGTIPIMLPTKFCRISGSTGSPNIGIPLASLQVGQGIP